MINKKTIKKLFQILDSYKKQLLITLAATIFISVMGVCDSFLLCYIIDNVICSYEKSTLLTISVVMLIIAFFQIALKGIKSIIIKQMSYKLDIQLMHDFYSKIMYLNFTFFEKHKSGELVSRINDTRIVRSVLSEGIISIATNLIMFFVVGFALFHINKKLCVILFISVIILVFIVIRFACFFNKEYPIYMDNYADMQAFITESFSSVEAIKTFPAVSYFINEFNKKQNKNIFFSWRIDEKEILENTYSSVIERISTILVIVYGAYLVIGERMSLGQVASFISLSGFFISSIMSLVDLQAGIQEAFSAIKRLFQIMDEPIESCYNDTTNSSHVLNTVPKISFCNISFGYNKNTLYDNFSLTINPGEWISFVGSTGCGKTTLVKLLLKLYYPQKGKILLDEIDLQSINSTLLYSKIAYIPQDICLFAGTIKENITMFNSEMSDNEIEECLKIVGLYTKIQKLPENINTLLGEKGCSLSGGEKQKIVIARALMKKPKVMILDEATSNLDLDSEMQIMKIIKQIKQQGITIITIAHRLSTVKNCDRIIFLKAGKISEQGSHEELLKKDGEYSHLWNKNI